MPFNLLSYWRGRFIFKLLGFGFVSYSSTLLLRKYLCPGHMAELDGYHAGC